MCILPTIPPGEYACKYWSMRRRVRASSDWARLASCRRWCARQAIPQIGRWSLQPFDLVAAKFVADGVRFSRPQVKLDPAVNSNLERRITDLSQRVATLANPAPLPLLANPGFEASPERGQIPGWTLSLPEKSHGEIDRNVHRGGEQSLRFDSTGGRPSVRSAVLDPPATGRLSVALWLKVADKKRQPVVRLAVEGRINDTDYRRFATVGGSGPGQVPLDEQWAQYIYQVDDLPAQGVSDLRIRFDLLGAGEVWIDDVQVYDLSFSDAERLELSKLVALAADKRGNGQYSGCLQLLDSYWPQFLVEHVPLTQGPGAVARRVVPKRKSVAPLQPPAEEKSEESAKKQGWLNQLKGFVPRFSDE